MKIKKYKMKACVRISGKDIDYSIYIVEDDKRGRVACNLSNGIGYGFGVVSSYIPLWEAVGIEVIGKRYKDGQWGPEKPIRSFSKFKEI